MSSKVYDSMPECDRVGSSFLFKSYSALFPLLSTHGLKFEVGRLFMSANQYLLFLSFPEFCGVLFYLFYVPLPARCLNHFLCIGCALGNDGIFDMKDEVCSNPSVFRILENSRTC